MTDYVREGIDKGATTESPADDALRTERHRNAVDIRHGDWIRKAQADLKSKRFTSPLFALVTIFAFLFGGSIYLFENLPVVMGDPLYALKITMSSVFAISFGFILSVWWQSTSRFNNRLRDAERIDREYRELLIGFSDSLFDIIDELNTLATEPPKPFAVATEFLLGEYIHLLQSQLQRYGDYITGLGFDATAFLDEKVGIFEGIRERASLSVKGMPKEIESLFEDGLSLQAEKLFDPVVRRQLDLREALEGIGLKDQAA